jgi:hypothetical protein
MRTRLWVIGALLLSAMPVAAQETRGNISGTVSDSSGVVPGATVTVTNVETGVSQRLISNGSGYFEAPLLNPGSYQVTVEMSGFKTLSQSGITLSVGQQIALQLTLEVGTLAERVEVTANAPLLDTSTTSSGLRFEQRLVQDLPMLSNMPVLLARTVSGVNANGQVPFAAQGFVGGPSGQAGVIGGAGSTEYTIDGATNNGQNRQMATSPNADMVQEMRIETSNFDAAVGHGSGLGISMMTRAGTNQRRATVTHQYWTNRLNGADFFKQQVFDTNPAAEKTFEDGKSNNLSLTYGSPLSIPGLFSGQNKLFMFLNYSYANDFLPGKSGMNSTIANDNHLRGDFSDLLRLPNPAQYQIYDPLTTRPDPARPGHVIRDPFPNNVIPANRIVNPMYAKYIAFLPKPNVPIPAGVAPSNNYLGAAEPDPVKSHVWGGRVDYNLSPANRIFFRGSGSHFLENAEDWTYENPESNYLHALYRLRKTWSYTGNWTHVRGNTVMDSQLSANFFSEGDQRLGLKRFKPSELGLPAYIDEFCGGRRGGCQMPQIQTAGYRSFGNDVGTFGSVRNIQGQFNVTQVRGGHTLRAGTDNRQHRRNIANAGNTSPVLTFNNTYTRAADDTTVFPAQDLGLSWAAFMMGIPSSISIDDNVAPQVQSGFYSVYGQDSWRVTQNLTINLGLRYEYETGIRELDDRNIVGFDPNAVLAITSLAEAAYAANPIPQRPANTFVVRGGTVFASGEGQSGDSWRGESMWMPRASLAWRLGDKSVVKAGYGLYFDTLNASAYTPNTSGFSVTTTNVVSNDFGLTWALGDPRRGILPIADPFPVRADGTRYNPPVGDLFGPDTQTGTNVNVPNLNREHARVQRWRVSAQRELTRNTAVEVAYTGSYADRLSASIRQDYLPESYWNDSSVRDTAQQTFLNANVPNPFNIANFAALRTSHPALYARMAGNSFFTATTVQRHRLLRGPFPQLSTANYADLPLGVTKVHGIEANFSRRLSNGLSASLGYTGSRIRNLETVHEFDREPYLWQPSPNGRPHRLSANWIAELPFGTGKRFLNSGGVMASVLGGWQTSGTYEYQPGALLTWGPPPNGPANIFFYGDLNDIAIDNPTLDRWFNTDAGFEKDPARAPAAFQKRQFPFRIEGVRGPDLKMLSLNVMRTFSLGARRTAQFRVDVINALNRDTFSNPNVDPTSTNFGRITTVNGSTMRFVTFVTKLNF